MARQAHILLVEDNKADVRLTREALRMGKVKGEMSVARSAKEALAMLRGEGSYHGAPRPHLILLDLNLPGMGGLELLAEIKGDPDLRRIPVIVLTTSRAEEDVRRAYDLHANCYVAKPAGLDRFVEMVKAIEGFWLKLAELPGK
jgi:CheY-like chemotaxis protein